MLISKYAFSPFQEMTGNVAKPNEWQGKTSLCNKSAEIIYYLITKMKM
jgi:hypothetical protein